VDEIGVVPAPQERGSWIAEGGGKHLFSFEEKSWKRDPGGEGKILFNHEEERKKRGKLPSVSKKNSFGVGEEGQKIDGKDQFAVGRV